MSHRAATPPSFATRALHGTASLNGLRPAPGNADRRGMEQRPLESGRAPIGILPASPRKPPAIAITAHPLFRGIIKQPLLLAGAVITFLGGLLTGHLATALWPDPQNWFGSDKPVQAVVLNKLTRELALTPAQTNRIAPVIALSCANLRLLSEERRARRLALMDEIGTTIAPDLTPAQRLRLDDLEAEWQNRPSKHDERIVALY